MLISLTLTNYRSIRQHALSTCHRHKAPGSRRATFGKVPSFFELVPEKELDACDLIRGLDALSRTVVYSAHYPTLNLMEPRKKKAPCRFEIRFLHKDLLFHYGFVADSKWVHSEFLTSFNKGKVRKWFQREYENCWCEPWLRGNLKQIADATRPDSLFLSNAAFCHHRELGEVLAWFLDRLRVYAPQRSMLDEAIAWSRGELENRCLVRFLQDQGFKVSEIRPNLGSHGRHPSTVVMVQGASLSEIRLVHCSPLFQRLFSLGPILIEARHQPHVLVVNDLKQGLDQSQVKKLIEPFQKEVNGAQLIIT